MLTNTCPHKLTNYMSLCVNISLEIILGLFIDMLLDVNMSLTVIIWSIVDIPLYVNMSLNDKYSRCWVCIPMFFYHANYVNTYAMFVSYFVFHDSNFLKRKKKSAKILDISKTKNIMYVLGCNSNLIHVLFFC